jgi:neutral ceramidase
MIWRRTKRVFSMELDYRAWIVGFLMGCTGSPVMATGLLEGLPDSGMPAQAAGSSGPSHDFKVGMAERDITPERPVPMWGYGARHDRLSEGVIDRLRAKALVIQAGTAKVAIVGMDLGRAPTSFMMERIRAGVAQRGIAHVLICGSHTHHGPVIELTDQAGFGKGKFDDAVAYARGLPERIAAAILEADGNLRPARIGVATRDLTLNRNRHTKRPERPTDPRLTVIRFDRAEGGAPIGILVHYTAHPVLTPGEVLKFSADYPGYLKAHVEKELKAPCLFIQGAAGDQSANPPEGKRAPQAYGELLGAEAVELARDLKTTTPRQPSLAATVDRFEFTSRVNFKSSITFLLYAKSFFPELIRNFFQQFAQGLKPEITTVVLNGDLAIVGVPGEPFCQHAVRLRQRAYLPTVLVFGYCNDHLLYFPTIEAASEGGYGADPQVSPIALGGGETMMNQALISIYRLVGKFPEQPVSETKPPLAGASPVKPSATGAAR